MEERVPKQDLSAVARQSRGTVLFQCGIGIVLTMASGYMALNMPSLVDQGGMAAALGAQGMAQLSPVFFPELSFALTCLISGIFLFQSVRCLPGAIRAEGGGAGANYWNVVLMCALVMMYALLLPFLGFGIATLIAIGTISCLLGQRSWWKLISFSIVTPVVIRFLFERVLLISLPLSSIELLTQIEQGLMQFLVNLLFIG